jgi:hypothetical protein
VPFVQVGPLFMVTSPTRGGASSRVLPETRHNGVVNIEREGASRNRADTPPVDTPLWRDPLSMSFRAHRQVMLLRLRWHERQQTDPVGRRRPLRAGRRARKRP